MKRSITSLLLAVVLPLGASAAVLATTSTADAQYRYYRAGYGVPYTYYARYRPVYYNGYAHYYWNGYWHYRGPDGAWYYYQNAPGELCRYNSYYGVTNCSY